jgi:y4mF family transcriptional regulator
MTVARNARDAGAAIRAARLSRRLTQGQLAERAGVGRQWLVAVEKGHDRAELAKFTAVLSALGVTLTFAPPLDAGLTGRTWLTAPDTAEAIREELQRGDDDFALRILGRALSDLRSLDDPRDIALFMAEPPSTGDHRWDTLLAATVGRQCHKTGIAPPAWTRPEPLQTW